jgi:hypothetical protein
MIASRRLAPMMALALFLGGCSSIGPLVVARDRFDYNGEVSRSWKEQMLLNIVKSRYLDPPVFLDVSQIVSGYTIQGTVTAGTDSDNTAISGLSAGVSGVYTDRPTITYTPLTGAQFNREIMQPIPPSTILFAMTSGWPVDLVFRVAVRGINGVENDGPDEARYDRLLVDMRALQQADALGMRVISEDKGETVALLYFRPMALKPEQAAVLREVRTILALPDDTDEFRVRFGQLKARKGEISLLTRSMLQILVDFGSFVDVPDVDLKAGRVPAGAPIRPGVGRLHVKYSADKPDGPFVGVEYRKGWFWIDDTDLDSKRSFSLVLLLSTLTETGGRESLPLVTIPAG